MRFRMCLAAAAFATAGVSLGGVGLRADDNKAAAGDPAPAAATDAQKPENIEWPCVWHRVVELGAATIWDGPPLDKAEGWRSDDTIRNLSSFLIARKHKPEDAEAAVSKYAADLPADKKDAKLTELFAAVLSRTNEDRKLVIGGIERFHKRQLERAKQIEKLGGTVSDAVPGVDPKSPDEPLDAQTFDKLTDEQEKLKWEIRVFQERQQNIPFACEIPQLMDERAGVIARAIRAQMKS